MRRRPLCFLCIALVVLNFIYITSGDGNASPDVFSFSEQSTQSYVTVYGEIYQCEDAQEQQILYLKQTVLSEINSNVEISTNDIETQNHIIVDNSESVISNMQEGYINLQSSIEKNAAINFQSSIEKNAVMNFQSSIMNHAVINFQNSMADNTNSYHKLTRIRVTCKNGDDQFKIGDLVSVYGKLKEITAATNPGQFDSQSYYAGKKIGYTMWEPEITLIERPQFHFQRFLYEVRCYFADVISECVGEWGNLTNSDSYKSIGDGISSFGNVMRGIVLGDKGVISQDTKNLYQIGGISHILAISAMHLTILGNGLYELLKRFGVPIKVAGAIAGVFLTVYGILTGASVATVRALIMFLLNIGAQLTGRTYDGKTSLSLAAVLLLSGNPLSLTDSGFLLSFSAMLSFALFKENRQLGSSILLYFFMAPVTLWLFYEIPLYSVFVNLLVVPTLAVVLVSGVAVCLAGSVSLFLGKLAAIPGMVLLYLYEMLCKLTGRMPFAKLVLGRPSVFCILAYYGVMLLTLWLFRRYRLSWKRFFLYFLMIPAIVLLVYHPQTELQITSLDVGQGDCMIVETPGNHTYMIDGGSSSVESVGNYRIWPYLKYKGISKLDAVFVTHPDGDHISGILELLEMISDRKIALQIEQIILPQWENMTPFEEVMELANAAGVTVVQMEAGDCLVDGKVSLECLYPSGEDFTNRLNEGSLVLQISYKEFSGLLTGDLEGEGEEAVLDALTDVDYLKVAHHGSKNSTFEAFLEKTKPEISIISCGKSNLYGHPHAELLERLEAAESDVYATKDWGAMWICTDGEKIDLHTFCSYNEL